YDLVENFAVHLLKKTSSLGNKSKPSYKQNTERATLYGPPVRLPVDKLKWLDGVCNCPAFFKNLMCKHVVGIAIRLNCCKPPSAAKDVKIGEKRRGGRPSKSKKALLMQ
ncbi:unnamed protein product, partial [Didymodactylos carnosus]